MGTDEDTLIEILCTRSNAELTAIKEAFQRSKLSVSLPFMSQVGRMKNMVKLFGNKSSKFLSRKNHDLTTVR